MDLVLCHTTADFDTLGAAVGVTRLLPGSRIVLSGGSHPTVQAFLALHRDEYALIERRAVNLEQVRSLTIVDTQQRQRLGPASDWITWAAANQIPIALYDHHLEAAADIPAAQCWIDSVGAATTLVVEQLQAQQLALSVAEATVMALGIHVDTGSLRFEQTTARDAEALAWLMRQGASLRAIADFVEPILTPQTQALLNQAMAQLTTETLQGLTLTWVLLPLAQQTPGLSGLAERLMAIADSDVLLVGAHAPLKAGSLAGPSVGQQQTAPAVDPLPEGLSGALLATGGSEEPAVAEQKLVLIGRARRRAAGDQRGGINFSDIFQPLGGGGHPTAAAVSLTTADPQQQFEQVLRQVRSQLPQPPTARELMSSPVRTIRPDTSIQAAQRLLLRYGHSGLSVVDEADQLVGIISRRNIDLALHHGFSHAPVKGYMTTELKTIAPDTSLPQIEHLMVTYDIGRLPVLEAGQLVGIVTRTDVLRQLHQAQPQPGSLSETAGTWPRLQPGALLQRLQQVLKPALWQVLQQITEAATARGWHLYLVGGAVRDLLLSGDSSGDSLGDSSGDSSGELAALELQDIDLVVDGFYQAAEVGAGVALAESIKATYHHVDLQVYGRFQTAALVWHKDDPSGLGATLIDIATARTEFYPYPAANPEVEASSIQQDLYRRDFTINAMALRLSQPGSGTLLDFFGGTRDLRQRLIRVLHTNSFIEDPTRIYRAVRFAVRLNFELEPQTERSIRYAIASGIYSQTLQQAAEVPALQSRLRNELKYILETPYWQPALHLLDRLGALQCLHSSLTMSDRLWRQLRRIGRWIERFGWQQQLPPWEMRLEVLLAAIPAPDRAKVAAQLQLSAASQARLQALEAYEQDWRSSLPTCDRPSQVVEALRPVALGTLLLVGVRQPQPLGQIIWRYLNRWSTVKPLLDGNALKTLGYPPGPAYRPMLDTVLAATLDQEITTPEAAAALLAKRYGPPPSA